MYDIQLSPSGGQSSSGRRTPRRSVGGTLAIETVEPCLDECTPGPGAYRDAMPGSLSPRSARIGSAQRDIGWRIKDVASKVCSTPGPQDYSADKLAQRSSPSARMMSPRRGVILTPDGLYVHSDKDREKSPGPGAYQAARSCLSRQASVYFKGSHRRSAEWLYQQGDSNRQYAIGRSLSPILRKCTSANASMMSSELNRTRDSLATGRHGNAYVSATKQFDQRGQSPKNTRSAPTNTTPGRRTQGRAPESMQARPKSASTSHNSHPANQNVKHIDALPVAPSQDTKNQSMRPLNPPMLSPDKENNMKVSNDDIELMRNGSRIMFQESVGDDRTQIDAPDDSGRTPSQRHSRSDLEEDAKGRRPWAFRGAVGEPSEQAPPVLGAVVDFDMVDSKIGADGSYAPRVSRQANERMREPRYLRGTFTSKRKADIVANIKGR